jgi:hypothetical protein
VDGRRHVGRDRGRRRGIDLEEVRDERLDRDAVLGRVDERRLDAARLVVDGEHGLPAEQRGGDREDAGAAAEVGERAAGRQAGEQLEAHLGRRVRAGAERAARRVDHDVEDVVSGRVGL